jgi:hypothetical protein
MNFRVWSAARSAASSVSGSHCGAQAWAQSFAAMRAGGQNSSDGGVTFYIHTRRGADNESKLLSCPVRHRAVIDEDLLLRAIEIYELDRLDFAEAYVVACAERSGVGAVASFDGSIDRVRSVERIGPRAERP